MFADVFNELLAENDLTKKSFSEQSGIPYPTIIGWTNLNRLPDFSALKKIADFFHCSVDFLMERQDSALVPRESERAKAERDLIFFFRKLNEENQEIIYKLTKNLSNR